MPASTLEAGKPARFFLLPDGINNNYDVTPDGQRFLIATNSPLPWSPIGPPRQKQWG
jgi:hypothetical protein